MSDGAYYYQLERPEPVELLANSPYATGTECQAASGTGAFLVDAERMVEVLKD